MVFGFISSTVTPPALIFMGEHQVENEKLFKCGDPGDVWFHVDKVSSAHVYLQLPSGITIDTIPEELLEECCQLVKKNSIQGVKMEKVEVNYTLKENLKKVKGMQTGEIGFYDKNIIKSRSVLKKNTKKVLQQLEGTQWKT